MKQKKKIPYDMRTKTDTSNWKSANIVCSSQFGKTF